MLTAGEDRERAGRGGRHAIRMMLSQAFLSPLPLFIHLGWGYGPSLPWLAVWVLPNTCNGPPSSPQECAQLTLSHLSLFILPINAAGLLSRSRYPLSQTWKVWLGASVAPVADLVSLV